MTRVLLVTGSRSLADHPGAEAWARGLIRAALADVDLLIVGDAPGPDAWARSEAKFTPLVHVYFARGDAAGRVLRFAPFDSQTAVWAHDGNTHPLRRNAVMVRACVEGGADVRCLALLDGTKRDVPGRRATRGTEHTAGLAERAGITVQRKVWTEMEGR